MLRFCNQQQEKRNDFWFTFATYLPVCNAHVCIYNVYFYLSLKKSTQHSQQPQKASFFLCVFNLLRVSGFLQGMVKLQYKCTIIYLGKKFTFDRKYNQNLKLSEEKCIAFYFHDISYAKLSKIAKISNIVFEIDKTKIYQNLHRAIHSFQEISDQPPPQWTILLDKASVVISTFV